MTGKARHPHLTRGGRLLALLLAVLLSVSSLTSEAAMDSCAADCSVAQVELIDHADPDCSACAALAESPLFISVHSDTLAGSFPPAMVEYISPPSHQPPRS